MKFRTFSGEIHESGECWQKKGDKKTGLLPGSGGKF